MTRTSLLIEIVTPAGRGSKSGNRNTAVRWSGFLRDLGHHPRVSVEWSGKRTDLMIALHARRSHESIARFRNRCPEAPVVLALTGTDLYRDIRTDVSARLSMDWADRMIVLQDQGLQELPPGLRAKTRVVYQSARALARAPALRSRWEVCVVGHLREEKDPFRAALAMRYIPATSRIGVVQLGRAMSPDMEAQALAMMSSEPRYRWLGERPHWQVRQILARARLMVISSRMEGGANVVSEAIAAGLPVIASRIPGNLGMLGTDYPGYYRVEDEKALGRLLVRAETDATFYRSLAAACRTRRRLTTAENERHALAAAISGLATA